MNRRTALLLLGGGPLLLAGCGYRDPDDSAVGPPVSRPGLAALEARFQGRLGVYALDTGSGETMEYRSDERFPICSTFKALAAGAVLRLGQSRPGLLDQVIRWPASEVVSASPVTEKHVADGMTVAALCQAAVTMSDNTAGNQLLKLIGGPGGLTEFARSLGDRVTRLDRWEPELNVVAPGEERDTTTPAAMAANIRALVLGDALDSTGRDLLTGWLVGNQTGGARIRAGLPGQWRVGDKTGGGAAGEASDVAVAWPPEHEPLVIAVYTVPADGKPNNPVLAAAATEVARTLVPPAG